MQKFKSKHLFFLFCTEMAKYFAVWYTTSNSYTNTLGGLNWLLLSSLWRSCFLLLKFAIGSPSLYYFKCSILMQMGFFSLLLFTWLLSLFYTAVLKWFWTLRFTVNKKKSNWQQILSTCTTISANFIASIYQILHIFIWIQIYMYKCYIVLVSTTTTSVFLSFSRMRKLINTTDFVIHCYNKNPQFCIWFPNV